VSSFDKIRIDALLADLRKLDPDADDLPRLHELARKHQLDPMVVRRIAESEGFDLKNGDAVPEPVDETASTGPIDVD
jgi:hypothetical protein